MEQDQFKNTIIPLRPKLINYARRILENEDEAEDIVQEVFFKLWYMRYDLDKYDNIQAVSMTITKNLSINNLRIRQKKRGALAEMPLINESQTPHNQLEQKDEVERVMRIVKLQLKVYR